MTTPPHVPVTGVQCSTCHTNTAANFATYTMGVPGHAAVSTSRCDSCHNGSFTGEGTTGAQGTASFPGHVATTGAIASPVTPARPGLRQLGGREIHPRGDRYQLLELPQRHDRDRHEDAAAYPGGRCPVQQLPHQYGGELYDLHDGRDQVNVRQRQPLQLLSQRLVHRRRNDGRAGTASFPNHVATNGSDCVTCHASAARPSPAGRAESSPTRRPTPIARTATTAPPRPVMKTPPHIPVAGIQCSNCHTNTAASFITYTMGVPGHTSVSASRCDSCHNGSFTGEGTTGANGTASFPDHVATNGSDCAVCHASAASAFASWAGGKYTTRRPTRIARAATTAPPRPA